MEKNKARKILSDCGYTNIVEINMQPRKYLDVHSHDWNVDIIILKGTLQVNTKIESKTLKPGERFQLNSNIEHTEYSGTNGVSFLSARPTK